MSEFVYLNGRIVGYDEALIGVEDRGNLFADGIYEVILYRGGQPFEMERHLKRLAASAAAIRIPLPFDERELVDAAAQLVARNGLAQPGVGASVYVQVSRGIAPRTHAFPQQITPTYFMIARPFSEYPRSFVEQGVTAILLPDTRWAMCNVKSIALLPNILAKQEAVSRGAFEALLVRGEVVTEGSSSNLFAVVGGVLRTHPLGCEILPGVTRALIVELAAQLGVVVEQRALTPAELFGCAEAFLTGTISGVMPLVEVDGRPLGAGRPGPITMRLYEALRAQVHALG